MNLHKIHPEIPFYFLISKHKDVTISSQQIFLFRKIFNSCARTAVEMNIMNIL